MVFGALASGALSMWDLGYSNWDGVSMNLGLACSGRGAKVDQTFAKLFSQIDYKIQRQQLHRDDIRDLVDLTVSRMDMYNVVGALLLTFALQWVVQNSVVSAEKESFYWPRWFSTIFIVHCFSAAGYLLFSLWFSMHCSIMSKAQGTKLLLHFARLTIPIREEIDKIKVRFYSAGPLAKLAEHVKSNVQDVARGSKDGALLNPFADGDSDSDDEAKGKPQLEKEMPLDFTGFADDECLNDSDTDFQRHLRMWVKERGKWLSYDAYSRACMVVGMNQLLAAVCYDLTASMWDVSQISTLLCVMLAKVLSFHIYEVDVSISSLKQAALYFFGDFLPPVLAFPLMLIMPPQGTEKLAAQSALSTMELFSIPLFVLNSLWMLIIAEQLRESKVRGQAPSPGTDAGSSSECSESLTEGADGPNGGARGRSPGESQWTSPGCSPACVNADAHDIHWGTPGAGVAQDGLENLPKAFLGRSYLGRQARSLYQVFHLEKAFVPAPGIDWFDHTPARIVRSFTLVLAAWWLVAGVTHSAYALFIQAPAADAHQLSMQRLTVPWPEPASVFEVKSLLCGVQREMLVRGRSETFRTSSLPNGTLASFVAVEGTASALLCGGEGCDALVRLGATWSLMPLAELCSTSGPSTPPQPVPIPSSWHIMAGAWESRGPQRQAVLAGWDGKSITVSALRRHASNGSWLVQPRFRLHPGIGRCTAVAGVCEKWRATKYDNVLALQLGPGGRSLAVLSALGALDGWSLGKGEMVGRWRLGGEKNFTAMCHDGSRLYASRIGTEGPVLETSALPEIFLEQGPERNSSTTPLPTGRLIR